MKNNELMLVANDLGYGFLKSTVNGKKYKMPSVIAKKQVYMDPNPDELTKEYMKNFLDKMDVSISSSAVKRTGRFLIGRAASKTTARTQSFNIFSGQGKSDDDLSLILNLSMIAGVRVKNAYENDEDLDCPLVANVIMATELPIAEGRDSEASAAYENKYLNSKHTVTFNNFKNPITVTVNFLMVHSYLEGETASLALANAAAGLEGYEELDGLKEKIDSYYKKYYPQRVEDYGIDEILQAQNIFVMDIGERTSDLVTTTNGSANPEASDSINLGYGNAIEKTKQAARIKGLGTFKSRYELKEFLSRNLIGSNEEKQEKINEILQSNILELSDGILDSASDLLSMNANKTDVVYVLGGGSIPMEKESNLRQELVELLQSIGAMSPVIWIDEKYAQWVNELGLQIILGAMVEQAKEDGLID